MMEGAGGRITVDKTRRILELYQEGFGCSQILLLLGLKARGQSSPALIRAMSGGRRGGLVEQPVRRPDRGSLSVGPLCR